MSLLTEAVEFAKHGSTLIAFLAAGTSATIWIYKVNERAKDAVCRITKLEQDIDVKLEQNSAKLDNIKDELSTLSSDIRYLFGRFKVTIPPRN